MDDLNFSSFGDIQNESSESFYLLSVTEIIVTNMNYMFGGCSSLISLPDLSKWNTQNVKSIESMFNGCSSLISLPDLSKWNTNNVERKDKIFNECLNTIIIPF